MGREKRQQFVGLLTKMFHVKRSLVQENETRTCAKEREEARTYNREHQFVRHSAGERVRGNVHA
jgi:hypothetical protein